MASPHIDPAIVADVQRVAEHLGTSVLSRPEYVQHGRFSTYQIYDGGTTWEDYCRAANLQSKKKEKVPDEVYFGRLVRAIQELGGAHPKESERKKFGLNFSKRRFATLPAFIQVAIERGIIDDPNSLNPRQALELKAVPIEQKSPISISVSPQPTPPIPAQTNRTKWERIDIPGFPYAPQDESGTVALFGILCSQRTIQWDILDLNAGKGIDCICWDHVMKRELRVEIKYLLTRASWNHSLEELDYVVCWENRWPDFQKPVVVLRTLLSR